MKDSNAVIIEESGMRFGPYDQDDLYHIEASKAYAGLGKGFPIVEFVWLRHHNEKQYLYFIEAKSSSPNPENGKERFDEWVEEIVEKFSYSVPLFLATELGIHPDDGIGRHLRNADISECGIKLILVISRHKQEWLPPIRVALEKNTKMKKVLRIWNAKIIPLNRDMAFSYGLMQKSQIES